jgi:hypothetical protein
MSARDPPAKRFPRIRNFPETPRCFSSPFSAPPARPPVDARNALKIRDTLQLNSGRHIPLLGFGTWQLKDGQEVKDAVTTALKVGYRHIDTASAYDNESGWARPSARAGCRAAKCSYYENLE